MKLWQAKLWRTNCRFHRRNIKREKFSRKLLAIRQICQSFPPSNFVLQVWYGLLCMLE